MNTQADVTDDLTWVDAAIGKGPNQERFHFRSELLTHREFRDPLAFQPWHSTISIVDVDDGGEEVRSIEIASAVGIRFDLPQLGVRTWDSLLSDADEESTWLLDAVYRMSRERDLDELFGLSAIDAFYVDFVWVDPRVRGHRWGRSTAADMLSALDLSFSLVLTHLPAEDAEDRGAAEGIVESFGMQRLGSDDRIGTELLFVGHGVSTPFLHALKQWKDGPHGPDGAER